MNISSFLISTLKKLEPSETKLLKMLCELMEEEMIREVSMIDYGQNAEVVFTELKNCIKRKSFPKEMSTYLHENLQLYRWFSNPGRKQHISRALSCLLLLNLNENTTYDYDADDITLGILMSSVLEIGNECYKPLLQFVAWKALNSYQEERGYCLEEEENIEEIEMEEYLNCSLILLLILNEESEEDIIEVFNHLSYYDRDNRYINRVESFVKFLKYSNSLVKPTIWTEITLNVLGDIDFLKNQKLKEELSIILNSFKN